MKAKKNYNNGGKVKGGKLKGANKVTGAKSTHYSKKESAEYWDGARMSTAALSGRRGANILRKEGLGGTPQKPSPAMGGAKYIADMLGENTDNIPRRKLTPRELTTAADKSLKKPGKSVSDGMSSSSKMKAKKKKKEGKYMYGGKVYAESGAMIKAMLKDPKQAAMARKVLGMD